MTLSIRGAIDSSGARLDLTVGDRIMSVEDPSSTVLDATGLTPLAGFIDIQTNGGFGHDFTQDPRSIWTVGEILPSTGVTAFCPTIITAAEGTIEQAQAAIAARPEGYRGAEPLGLHIEGPHLSEARHGTHPLGLLRPPSEWRSSTEDVAIVTIAPELPGALDLIGRLVADGIVVSIGHSAAPTDIAREALDAGATLGTHLLNAMEPIRGREPGIAGVLLTDHRARFGLIVDDIHLAPETVRLAWAAASERLILITDAIAAAGMADGTFEIGGIEVTLRDGAVRNTDGDLAGSSLTMDRAVRNLADTTGADLASAARCATRNPADALGIADRGSLEVDSTGDVVLLDGYEVAATIVRGTVAYLREPDRLKGALHASP
ncbi:MAG: N-acetylglucosamine-6-phosphate deacetylase [Actinomycetota bacterium]